jgi:hypothetical protein
MLRVPPRSKAPQPLAEEQASSSTSAGVIGLWCGGIGLLLVAIATMVTGEAYFDHVVTNAFPAAVFLIVELIARAILRDKDDPWSTAARPMIESACWALALLSLLLLVFNTWVMPRDDVAGVIRNVEAVMIRVATSLKTFTTISAALTVAILLVLLLVSRYRPALRTVSRFTSGRKHVGRLTAALTMATSFSFFGGEAIITDVGDRATQHATTGRGERPDHATQRFVAPARAVSEMPALTTEATDRLLDYAAWKEATGATEYDPRWELRERAVEVPLPRDCSNIRARRSTQRPARPPRAKRGPTPR